MPTLTRSPCTRRASDQPRADVQSMPTHGRRAGDRRPAPGARSAVDEAYLRALAMGQNMLLTSTALLMELEWGGQGGSSASSSPAGRTAAARTGSGASFGGQAASPEAPDQLGDSLAHAGAGAGAPDLFVAELQLDQAGQLQVVRAGAFALSASLAQVG